MWADEEAWTPAGAVPVRWVTSDTMLSSLELPHEAPSLLCEECETRDALVWSEADKEACCATCCLLLYPRTTNGKPHENFLKYRIRVVSQGDRSRALRQQQTPDFFSEIMDETRWSQLGRDLRQPSSTEAPKINPINNTSKSNRPTPKFRDHDVVVFNVEDYLPHEVQGQARLPPWRGREIWGCVMGTPHPRLGQYGMALRDGDEHEPWYRIECKRWIHVNATPDAQGMGRCVQYQEEMEAADRLYEERHSLDRKKEQVQRGFQMKNAQPAFLVRERALAWIRDRQLNNHIGSRQFALGEVYDGAQANSSAFPTVVLMRESALKAPAECRASLVRRRNHQCAVVLRIIDGWCYEKAMVKVFVHWVGITLAHMEQEREEAAKVLQRTLKALHDRMMMNALEAAAAQKEAMKNHFNFCITEEEKIRGFTTDEKHYFPTLRECELYAVKRQDAAKKVGEYMNKAIRADYIIAWPRWLRFLDIMKKTERVPVTHYGGAHTGLEVAPLYSHLLNGDDKEQNKQEKKEKDKATPPWHPGVGIDQKLLPPLPKMWSYRTVTGKVEPTNPQKFNSFQASMSGPIDKANWVIPDLIMMGSYLEGKARKKGRQPTPPEAGGQCLLSGIGTFVCLMTKKEMGDLQRLNGLPDLHTTLVKEHQSLQAFLKSTKVRSESQAKEAAREVQALPVYRTNDPRYMEARAEMQAAVAKERMAFASAERAKHAFTKVAPHVDMVHVEISEGSTLPHEELLKLLESIELSLRKNHGGVYLMSRLGHGRCAMVAACLLGRLYGLKARDALERVQSYHDSRVSVKGLGCSTPSPSTVEQVASVNRVLAEHEALYASVHHRDGPPTAPLTSDLVFPKLRGVGGPPRVLPPHLKHEPSHPQQQQQQKALSIGDHSHPHSHNAHHHPPADPAAAAAAAAELSEKLLLPRPLVTLPHLPLPVKPTNRDLRLSTSLEEEKMYGKRRVAMVLPPPDLGI